MDNFAVWNDAWEILNIRDSWVVIENGKKVIYYHFEKKHYVSKNDSSFESFSNLTRILGALEILQKSSMSKTVNQKIQLKLMAKMISIIKENMVILVSAWFSLSF